MIWRTEVIAAVRRGVRNACSDIPTFTENWSGTLAAEYLLTVRVAEAIRDLNAHHGGIGFPFKVYIEERTGKVIRKCLSCWPILEDTSTCKRIYRAVQRKGKVDIAVTHDSSPNAMPEPVCVIEVKGFAPTKRKVHEDLVRNANFMKVAELTSRTAMFTSLVALHKGKALDSAHKPDDIKAVSKQYRLAVCSLRSELRGIEVDYDIFTADEDLPQQAHGQVGFEDLDDARHHFIGAIVSFYRAAAPV